ncbi:HET-domain-containing protein [Daldinia eschscholtzii]|nr:HET-domain-containing protein [Daldinia eschscholtzii]
MLDMQVSHVSLEHHRSVYSCHTQKAAPINDGISMESPPKQRLCDQCRQLDLLAFFNSTWKGNLGKNRNTKEHYIPFERPVKQFQSIDCDLCTILSRAIDHTLANKIDKSDQGGYELRALGYSPLSYSGISYEYDEHFLSLFVHPSSNKLGWEGLWHGSRFFAELKRRCCIIIEPISDRPEPIVKTYSPKFDAQVVVDWIARCTSLDGTKCCPSRQPIRDLYLIDCYERTVVTAKGSPAYIALSYVWAPSSNVNVNYRLRLGENCDTPLPDNLSLTIQDAIVVTKSLGFRYLWVDKFCIAQNELEIKHSQIMQMDAVYANSELTIIATAGQDENYGLPGVSRRPRVATPTVELNGVRLSWFREPRRLIRESKWNTRGWTYQEAFLARRRLVFLDEHMYFECESASYSEMVPGFSIAAYEKSVNNDGIWNISSKSTDLLLDFCTKIVGDYTARELGYDGDSLLALVGVLNYLRKADSCFKHVWGVPWDLNKKYIENFREEWGLACDIFALGLCWTHVRDCWAGRRGPRRRSAAFPFSVVPASVPPSWTWAGWAGPVDWKQSIRFHRRIFRSVVQTQHFHLEDQHGNTTAVSTIAESGDLGENLRYPILSIETWAIPPDKIDPYRIGDGRVRWRTYEYTVAWISLSEGVHARFNIFNRLSEIGGRWRCILLGIFEFAHLEKRDEIIFLILRKERDEDLWVRVGAMMLVSRVDGTVDRAEQHFLSSFPRERFRIK